MTQTLLVGVTSASLALFALSPMTATPSRNSGGVNHG